MSAQGVEADDDANADDSDAENASPHILRSSLLRMFPLYTTFSGYENLSSHNLFGDIVGGFSNIRSYAALRAADLDWIVGPGYSSVFLYFYNSVFLYFYISLFLYF